MPPEQAEEAIDARQLNEPRAPSGKLPGADGGPGLTQVSIFDLDKTLTRRRTYTRMLVYAALRLSPVRLLLAPLVVVAMLGYKLGVISRRRVKEIEHGLLLGNAVSQAEIARAAEDFAAKLDVNGFFTEGRARIAAERSVGRRILLATAANRFYVDSLAKRLMIDEIVATGSSWRNGQLTAEIDGENCYGDAKREMVEAYFEQRGLRRADLQVRFFSDHISDRPTFEWSDEPVAVNPSRKLRDLARRRGWAIVAWS